MLQPIPPRVAALLGLDAPAAPGAPERVLISTESDLSPLGDSRPQWVVVTDRRIASFDLGEDGGEAPQRPLAEVLLDALRGARCDARVGSGALEVKLEGGEWREIVRFSNLLAHRFGRVAHKLQARSQGRTIVLTDEDRADRQHCAKCGRAIHRSMGTVCPRCVSKGRVLLRLLGLMRPYWHLGGPVLALLLAAIGLDLIPPRLTQLLVDDVFGTAAPSGVFGWVIRTLRLGSDRLLWLLALVAGLAMTQLVKVALQVVTGQLVTRIGTRITHDLRRQLYERLHELSIGYYDKNPVGTLMQRVNGDTEELHRFIYHITGGFLLNLLLLTAIGCMLFAMNPRLAFWTLVPAPFVIGSTFVFWNMVLPRAYRFWDSRTRVANVLHAGLSGIRVVRAFNQEEREVDRFARASERVRSTRIRMDRALTTFYPVVGFVFSMGGYIVWYAGGKEILGGHDGMTLGTLMAFFGYMGMFYAPMNQLTYMSQWSTNFTIAAYRIFEVLDTEPEVAPAKQPLRLGPLRGVIELAGVTFGYDPHYPVLHDLSLAIAPGEMVGIVGSSGSGKTSIINLICRFYDPTDGAVRIDGHDLRDVDKSDLRSQIGLVLQEPHLFRGTIRDNIGYARPSATTEQIIQAAKAANAHDFIVRMADGYDTRLGENGSGLSGGERQRVSIARAILCDPRILILDEATSSVDTESERAIQEALSVVARGRTTIAIAHRLSTLRNADRIIVLDQGRIVEVGTHEELMARDGTYARLVKIQLQLTRDTQTVDGLSVAPARAAAG
jgi:ATP-binding cassette subfamily B protein